MPPSVLQLCALIPSVQQQLDARYTIRRLPAAGANADWLSGHADEIQAVVTAGDLGIDTELAAALPRLGLVAINGVGYDKVDLDAARRRGIKVSNTPDVLTDDVADIAIGLMIMVKRGLVTADRHVRQGLWRSGPFTLARKVSGARYGIVGLGRIGQAIAHRLEGFGGEVLYTGRHNKKNDYAYYPDPRTLAAACDVLFIAAAASAATHGLIDAAVLAALGADGVLINVSRGSLIDEAALIRALQDGRIAGAGLDVFANEPHVPPALLDLPNVVLLPHVGSATRETRDAMGGLVIANLEAFFSGTALPTEVL